jgi:hypothetical protein
MHWTRSQVVLRQQRHGPDFDWRQIDYLSQQVELATLVHSLDQPSAVAARAGRQHHSSESAVPADRRRPSYELIIRVSRPSQSSTASRRQQSKLDVRVSRLSQSPKSIIQVSRLSQLLESAARVSRLGLSSVSTVRVCHPSQLLMLAILSG